MTEKLTRKQAIVQKCLDCCGGNKPEVRKCPLLDCPLWPFRTGTEKKGDNTAD